MRSGILCAVALLALMGATANASSLGPYSSTYPTTLTDWSGNLTFPMFSPSNGTLTAVVLDLSSSMSTVLTIHNTSPSGSTGWAKTEVVLTVQDPSGYFGNPQVDFLSPQYNFALGAGEQVTSGTLVRNGSNSGLSYTDAGTLAEFTGTGNISISAFTNTYAVISYTGGNTDAVQVTNASANGHITYFYDTPEPLTLSLLAVGGMALLRRRRCC